LTKKGQKHKGSFFTREFFREMLPIAIPIALQNLLMASFRLVDTLMIGQLGDVSLSAVGIAGNVSFLFELVCFGLGSGAAVFMAQFHGAGQRGEIRRTMGAALTLLAPIGVIFMLAAELFPTQIMGILTDDASLIEEGARYLVYAAPSYLGLLFMQTFSITLRCTENVKVPLITSGVSAVLNAVLNFVFIFGKLGLPAMGVAGAGLATSISSLFAPVLALVISFAQKNILIAPLSEIFRLKGFLWRFVKRSSFALANEVLWSFSVVLTNMVYARMGADSYAGMTAFRTIDNLVFVAFVGICSSCNVLVGKHIGAGDIEGGKRLSLQFSVLSAAVGIFLGAIILIVRNRVFGLFDISDKAISVAELLLLIYGFDLAIRNIPYLAVVGIFRAGGDTRIGLMGDAGVQYLLVVPAVFICGILLKLDLVTTYLIMCIVDDIGKNAIYIPYFLSMKWIKPVVLPNALRDGQVDDC